MENKEIYIYIRNDNKRELVQTYVGEVMKDGHFVYSIAPKGVVAKGSLGCNGKIVAVIRVGEFEKRAMVDFLATDLIEFYYTEKTNKKIDYSDFEKAYGGVTLAHVLAETDTCGKNGEGEHDFYDDKNVTVQAITPDQFINMMALYGDKQWKTY